MLSEIPNCLYRSFGELEHAGQFLDGGMRFGSFEYYRNIEDKSRRDETEGKSLILQEFIHFNSQTGHKEIRFGSISVLAGHPVSILCTHTKDPATLRSQDRKGVYIVKITSPEELACRIQEKLRLMYPGNFLNHAIVDYDKGELVDPENPQDKKTFFSRSVFQKPRQFSGENEYRFALRLSSADPSLKLTEKEDFITISIGNIRDIAELVLLNTEAA